VKISKFKIVLINLINKCLEVA